MQPTHNPIHLSAAAILEPVVDTSAATTLHGQHRGPTGRHNPTPTGAATLSGRLAAALRNGTEEQRSPRSVLQPVDQPRALPPESLLHGVIPATMWTSKLGTNYSLDDIRKNDKKSHAELQRIRWRPDNACATAPRRRRFGHCQHGTFVCLRCASVHRSLGTHISKPKGCTGTYLWGPDELDAMRPGNRVANIALLGDPAARLTPDVSDAALREHLIDKYEKKRWAPAVRPPEPPDLMTFDDPPPPPEEDFFASFGV